jgi:CRISPR-associated protein Csm5
MKNYSKRYKITLEIITPVHIGAGDSGKIRKNGYDILENGKVLIKQSLWSSEKDYEIDATNANTKQPHDFELFIKNPYGEPYIPGSSLKGAIRTCLMWGDLSFVNDKGNLIVPKEPVEDKWGGISISDSEPLSIKNLILCQKIDITPDGRENVIPTLRECLNPGVLVEFEMTLDNRWDIAEIEKKIKNFNKTYSQYLRKFNLPDFSEDENGKSDVYSIIYIGGGVGFESKVISPQTCDNKKHISYGSHLAKCTEYKNDLWQMGACEIRFEKI